jgi:hypothetical protein
MVIMATVFAAIKRVCNEHIKIQIQREVQRKIMEEKMKNWRRKISTK